MIHLLLLLFCLLAAGCQPDAPASYQEILGRDQKPYYRIKANGWQRKTLEGSLEDTTRPIAEFQLGEICATIHNFPGIKIPPSAQVARWQKQLPDSNEILISPQAFSGYVGLKFEGPGVVGWSMQIGPEFTPQGEAAADITIKVVGQVDAYKEEIEQFARSFELIEDL